MMTKKEEELLISSLKRMAPGTALRKGIEFILQAKTGGLLVLGDSEEVLKITNGGFYIGCNFTPERLYELAKIDGAIILSSDTKRILYANTHLFPSPEIPTSETGTRHITAERAAKQTGVLVISVSQKRDVVTIYVNSLKYIVDEPRVILSKANQAIQTLEKFKSGLNQLVYNLTVKELEGIVTLYDVVSVLQRSIIVQKTEKEVKKYIYELGSDGRLLKMQAEELMLNVIDDSLKIIKDYSCLDDSVSPSKIRLQIVEMDSDSLLELSNIAKVLGFEAEDNLIEITVQPKGYRIISEVRRLPVSVINNIINRFGNLKNIIDCSIEEISEVPGVGKVRAKSLHNRLKKFSEYYLYNEIFDSKGGIASRVVL
jgi:diadenylate cyclase